MVFPRLLANILKLKAQFPENPTKMMHQSMTNVHPNASKLDDATNQHTMQANSTLREFCMIMSIYYTL